MHWIPVREKAPETQAYHWDGTARSALLIVRSVTAAFIDADGRNVDGIRLNVGTSYIYQPGYIYSFDRGLSWRVLGEAEFQARFEEVTR